ncbi:ribosome recycling factor [Portibacter lacus]|uniref:Ribosome-recycling factor n=1 Tax=Portibacter lacus TaxID=1099794 RepID=A0AA37WFF0_9BACT|nr:ribosome recycling factor [Portibacter lacus]GLR18793.1 ribosome-recycling factor [Portibacter lacus]
MSEEMNIDENMMQGEENLDHAIEHLKNELSKIRAGKASPAMLSSIMVDYYGAPTPLPQVANVGTADSRTITIQPWEKNMLAPIERAIFEANLGLTPMNDGEFVRINIPPMTEERRVQLVKQSKAHGEDGKVSVRSVRHKMIDFIKKEVKNGYPEDAGKRKEEEVEQLVKKYYAKIDSLIEMKEKDIMTV